MEYIRIYDNQTMITICIHDFVNKKFGNIGMIPASVHQDSYGTNIALENKANQPTRGPFSTAILVC